MVMLTRVSIKVRLAWSTVAQMGFMVLECGLGLYMFAALHLVGHSLYKAHTFLSASGAVRDTRLRMLRGDSPVSLASLLAAPLLAAAAVLSINAATGIHWPVWWGLVLAFAWAPMLWLPSMRQVTLSLALWQGAVGLLALAALAVAAGLAHALPLGLNDRPDHLAGLVSVCGMALLYLCLVVLQTRPQALATWRRWSYAGFYLDEFYTRLALHLWPTRWTPQDEAAASRGLTAERRIAAARS
jgi:NAD(P)H-quinone oxidoreductase subunit 5